MFLFQISGVLILDWGLKKKSELGASLLCINLYGPYEVCLEFSNHFFLSEDVGG